MAEIKKISTELQLLDKFLDTSGDAGTAGQVLTSTGTGINWVSAGTPGSGVYLPLAGGTMTGSIVFNNNVAETWKDNAGATTRMMILNSTNVAYIGPIDTYAGGPILYGTSADVTAQIFYTGASERMRITSAGNVGIATTSPGTALQVGGLDDGSNYDITVGWNAVSSQAVGTKRSALTFKTSQTGVNNEDIYKWDIAMVTAPATASSEPFGSDLAFLRSTRSSTSVDETTMILTQLGNVGIGTTSPNQKLQVGGNLHVYDEVGNTDAAIFISTGTSNVTTVKIASNGNSFFNGGNVGIGTTSPGAKLNVTGNYGDVIKAVSGSQSIATNFVAPTTGSGLNNIISTAGEFNIGTSDAQPFSLATSSISRVSILSGGNVGIGTTSPVSKLEVNGGADAIATVTGTTTAARLDIKTNSYHRFLQTIESDGRFRLYNQTTSTEQLTVTNAGNVGIGTTSPNNKLDVNGGARVNGILTLNRGSIAGLKFSRGSDFYLGIDNSGNLNFLNDSASSLGVWKNDGNVGIGTTSPSYKLTSYSTTSEGDGTDEFPIVAGKANAIGNFTGIGLASYIAANGAVKAGIALERVSSYGTGKLHFLNSDTLSNSDATLSDSKMTILRNGNVGIGTTSPVSKLEVSSGAGANGDSILTISADTDNSTSSSSPKILMLQKGSTKTSLIEMDSSNRTHFSNVDGHYFSGGNVGIGTTNPTNKLHIQGSQATVYSSTDSGGQASAGTTINNTNTAGNTNNFSQLLFTVGTNNNSVSRIVAIRSGSDASDLAFVGKSAAGVAEYMRIKSGGNVGIGTTSPGSSLEVLKSASSTTISEARISSLVTGGYGGQANLWLRTSVYGSAMLAFGPQVGSSTVASSASGKISYNTFTRVFTVTADSNALLTLGGSLDRVGINQTSPLYTLDVTGNGRFTSTVTATNFINSSDKRLKENIEEVCNNNVEVSWKTFNFKTEKEQKRYGVIAQELEKTNPEFVREDSQGFKSVAYIDLLIAKIAELEARIQKLEK